LAVWEFAGLLVTYWCHARCAFCYENCGPERSGPAEAADVLAWWHGLDELARAHGKTMRIHLTGGEPFGDWTRLAAILRAAHDAGLTPADKVETNAFWATGDGLTRSRLELLRALGVQRLVVSTDVFHQEFVPFERVRRCVEIAREVFGPGCVLVRWWDFYRQPIDVRTLRPLERADAFRAALARHKDRLAGRAAEELAPLVECHPAAEFAGQNCTKEVLHSRHVHIDPHGFIFPGTCAGIILGQAGERTVAEVWQKLAAHWREHPVLAAVVAGGSYELMQRAKTLGYGERPDGYASKCHLCTHVRQFLFARGVWPECIGPEEVLT
jgi:hypothetical protein